LGLDSFNTFEAFRQPKAGHGRALLWF